MDNQEIYNKIDLYLLQRMSNSDRQNFEAEIQRDPSIAAQVVAQRDLLRGVQVIGKKQLKTTLHEIATEMDLDAIDVPIYGNFSDTEMQKGIHKAGQEQLQVNLEGLQKELEGEDFFDDVFATLDQQESVIQSPKNQAREGITRQLFPLRRILAVAASIALVVVASWFIIQNNTNPLTTAFAPDTVQLSQKIDAQLMGVGLGTGEIQQQLRQIRTGLSALQQGDYAVAISNLSIENPTFLSSTDRQLLQLVLGQAYLGAEQFNLAVTTLEPLAPDSNFVAQTDAKWYLLLAYAHLKNQKKVTDLKQQLQNSEKYKEKTKLI